MSSRCVTVNEPLRELPQTKVQAVELPMISTGSDNTRYVT